MATSRGHRSKVCWSSTKFARFEITSRIQSSHSGCEPITQAISTGYSIQAENCTSRPTHCADSTCHHKTPPSKILSGMEICMTLSEDTEFTITINCAGLSWCCRYIFIGRWRRSSLSRHGNSIDQSFGRVHARNDGTDTKKANVFVSNNPKRECEIVWIFGTVSLAAILD